MKRAPKAQRIVTMLGVSAPRALVRRLREYCDQHEITQTRFVVEAIEEKLTRETDGERDGRLPATRRARTGGRR